MARSIRIPLSSAMHDPRGTDTRRFGDGWLYLFDGVEVVDVVQQPTPPIPIFRHVTRMHGGRVAVMFLCEGEVQVVHGGARYRFLSGAAASVVTGTVTTVEAPVPCRAIIVSVGRDRLQQAGVDVTSTFGAFASAVARTSPLLTFAEALIDVVGEHEINAEPTATLLTQLVAGLFRADKAFGANDIGAGLELDFDGYRETARDFLLAQVTGATSP